MTIKEFIKENKIKFKVEQKYIENENMPNMNSYWCIIKYDKRQYSFPFFQGYGIKHDPTLSGVLDCLQSDCTCIIGNNVDDFLNDMGYTQNLKQVRKGEQCYKEILKEVSNLQRLFGDKYEAFLELTYE